MSLDDLFDNLRRGPWNSDPNSIPQEGGVGGGNIEPSGWLADDSVSADVISANAVTAAKIQAGAIEAGKIAAGAITADKIAAGAVEASKIAAGAVEAGNIAAGAITADKIAANAINASHIAAGAVATSELAADSVIASKIATNAVTADAIAANSVTASEIAANAITTSKIAAGEVTASRMALTISGKNFGANFGSVGAPGLFFDSNSDTGITGGSSSLSIAVNGGFRFNIGTAVTVWGSFLPGVTPANIGGVGSSRWTTVHCVTLNQSSDERLKGDIADSPLGLEFIQSLQPRSFRWLETDDTQAREEVVLDEPAMQAEIAPWAEYIVLSDEDRDDPDVAAGVEIARDEINEIVHRYVDPVEEAQRKTRPGRRTHYGLVAQEVKTALDQAGVDAAFWQQDTEGEQSLLYIELISPLIKAVQELAARVEELERAVRK